MPWHCCLCVPLEQPKTVFSLPPLSCPSRPTLGKAPATVAACEGTGPLSDAEAGADAATPGVTGSAGYAWSESMLGQRPHPPAGLEQHVATRNDQEEAARWLQDSVEGGCGCRTREEVAFDGPRPRLHAQCVPEHGAFRQSPLSLGRSVSDLIFRLGKNTHNPYLYWMDTLESEKLAVPPCRLRQVWSNYRRNVDLSPLTWKAFSLSFSSTLKLKALSDSQSTFRLSRTGKIAAIASPALLPRLFRLQ